ncbi:putative ABC transporter permease [Bifidobacterium sp. UTBIF-78]|uniref:putative ABC transporter permease n=1 Tax=Bifidobacterium sp. UTBIF-78 TaxID=1465263 RepID=UPI00112EB35C|nr:putative ABC transporter permease [Bifidobacterium sp. UTBIF-78]TPF95557.1 membrane protein [Bifidobacterium sp. UTBIF-78]
MTDHTSGKLGEDHAAEAAAVDNAVDAAAGAAVVNPGSESALEAELAAAELDGADLDLDAKRLPILARVYGVLVLLDGLATLPILVLSTVYSLREILEGRVHVDAMSLTFILTSLHAVVLIVNAVCLTVFGILLVRNRRRYAARWAYVLMPLTLADGMLSLALQGLGWNIVMPGIQMIILIVISVTADPSLREERRLQRALRRMDERDDYESAVAAGMLGRDQSGKGYIQLDFFNIFWLFTIASVGGLAIETIYHMALYHGELQDRAGLLWGPFSPIYGCGAVLVTVCLNRLWKANPFLIFCASAVIGGAFEYATSWFMEVAFGITAWDYTGQWLSIDGRTSGKYMFFWGLIGVVWVRWLLPRMLALINRIPWKVRYSLTTVCAVLMVIDIVFTLMALDCWYGRIAGQPQDSPAAMWFGEHFGNDYMAERFQTMNIDPSKAGLM